jgi:hypothetical protein
MPIHFGDFFKNTCDKFNNDLIGKTFSSPIVVSIVITLIILIMCYFLVYRQGKFKKSKQIPCLSKFGVCVMGAIFVIVIMHNQSLNIKYKKKTQLYDMKNILPEDPHLMEGRAEYHIIKPTFEQMGSDIVDDGEEGDELGVVL